MTEIRKLLQDDFTEIEGVEIFNTHPNTHKIKFTDKHIKEILGNYEKFSDIDKPGIKISHSDQQLLMRELFKMNDIPVGEEMPVGGVIKKLYQKGQSLMADFTNVPKVLKEHLFSGKYFKYISPEIIINYLGKHGLYLKHVALTNNPSLKHISDVHMSEGALFGGITILEDEVMSMAEKKIDTDAPVETSEVKLSDEATDSLYKKLMDGIKGQFKKEEAPAKAGTVTMSEVESMVSKALEKQNDEINTLKGKLIEKEQFQKDFSEKIQRVEENARIEKVDAICKSATLDGVPAATVNMLKPIMLSDKSDSMITLSETVDGEVVTADKTITSIIQGFFKNYPDKVDFGERTVTTPEKMGRDEDSRFAEIEKKANEHMAAGMTEFEAWSKAGEEV